MSALGMPTPPSPRPGRGGRRGLKIGIWIGFIFAVLLLLAGFLPMILSAFGGPILGMLSDKLGVPMEARRVSLSWTGSQRLDGVRVPQPKGFAPGQDMARVQSVVVHSGLLGLIFSKKEPVSVEVTEPVAHVIRNAQGQFNFEE